MDITKEVFFENFSSIADNLKNCVFIAFDAEFTAILSDERLKNRLFDTNQEKYDKIKGAMNEMLITQIGLTLFNYDRDLSIYKANAYTFHLRPQRFASIDQKFVLQASTLDFLCRHSFDFNKFIYNGIPYLSKEEEQAIMAMLNTDTTSTASLLKYLDIEEESELQLCCSQVSKWLTQSEDATLFISTESEILKYIIHKEIRMRFPKVLTTNSLGESNRILIYRNGEIDGATSMPEIQLKDNLMNYLMGFSKILKLIIKLKKPLIAHNAYLDVLLLYQQFIGHLPDKFIDFKRHMNKLFPHIYDTKYISVVMGKKLTMDEVWKTNSLQQLYEFFKEEQCSRLRGEVNRVECPAVFGERRHYHNAGWDSYCAGYCFFRLGHWSASLNMGTTKEVGPVQLFAALEEYKNKINVIRGAMPYINMSGADPPTHRPNLVLVKPQRNKKLDLAQVADALSGFGSVDVKPYGANAALVAANTHHTMNRILKNFPKESYRVAVFSPYLHSTAARVAIWSSTFLAGSIFIWFVQHKIKTT